jgi:hypothetical protein
MLIHHAQRCGMAIACVSAALAATFTIGHMLGLC